MHKPFFSTIFEISRRKKFAKKELKFLLLKAFLRETKIRPHIRLYLMQQIINRHYTRCRNRCLLTGKARSLVRKSGLSRMPFKLLINNGRFPGFKKDMF